MNKIKSLFIVLLLILVPILLDFGFGYIGVFKTRTLGKAQQNAERVVYEETESYINGKRQEALKFYNEYYSSSQDKKQSIKMIVSHSFAEFDENKFKEPLRGFIFNCKYNK